MASKPYGTLYVGVTNNIIRRAQEHREGTVEGFTKTHSVHNLVYYEEHEYAENAILREKRLKKWNRTWKIRLIEENNPEWRDLFMDFETDD